MTTCILGISAFYHDSAAAIIIDGKIIAAAQEERFTRIKHDASFPEHAIRYVLQEAGITYGQLTAVAFYDKPLLKFERLLETYHAFAPAGLTSFLRAIPVWLHEKLHMKKLLRKQFRKLENEVGKDGRDDVGGDQGKTGRQGNENNEGEKGEKSNRSRQAKSGSKNNKTRKANKVPIYFPEHHLSHAASAFYPSPFEEAAILTIDGVGEWATATICQGQSNQIKIMQELRFPHSVGLLYSAFTYYLGFKVNSGEYKLMGLAPYGDPQSPETSLFKEKILSTLVDIKEDGSILLNMSCFRFATGLRMTNDKKWAALLGIPRREPESGITPSHRNLALAMQQVTEMIVVALARTAQRITQSKNLVMAGGVALNGVANYQVLLSGCFDNIWIQPAAGDAGGALGAALAAYHIAEQMPRIIHYQPFTPAPDAMQAALLGPAYTQQEIADTIHRYNATAEYIADFPTLSARVSELLAAGKVIGWFQDRMEFGPRALGNRSILADPRNPRMQQHINLQIKAREAFRPFAPSVLEEDAAAYFDMQVPSPYMLFVTPLKTALRFSVPANYQQNIYERLSDPRSPVPAVTHVDYSARIQTVSKTTHPKYWQLIHDFKALTGCPMLINTSFNVRGAPIVCSPEDAFLAFMHTAIDYLVMGNYLLERAKQTAVQNIPAPEYMPD